MLYQNVRRMRIVIYRLGKRVLKNGMSIKLLNTLAFLFHWNDDQLG